MQRGADDGPAEVGRLGKVDYGADEEGNGEDVVEDALAVAGLEGEEVVDQLCKSVVSSPIHGCEGVSDGGGSQSTEYTRQIRPRASRILLE